MISRISTSVLSASAFSLADIRLTSILIIPDFTKTECNFLTPKTRQVYPKKWNTYGMGSKKWIIIICDSRQYPLKTNLGIMGGKWFLKMPTLWNFTERLQVSEVCPWVSRGEGRVEIQKPFREKKYGYFSGTTYWCEVHIVYRTNLKLC